MPAPLRSILLISLFLAAVAVAAQEPADAIADEITVFESRVTVDLGDVEARQLRRMRPQDLTILENGVPRRVTSLQRLRTAGDWRIVVYFDAPLSRSRTMRLAGQQLGQYAETLTTIGLVEVVVADPKPRTIFGPEQNERLLERVLAEVEADELATDLLRSNRQVFKDLGAALPNNDSRRQHHLHEEEDLVRGRVDHLLRLTSDGCDDRPCLLVLVSDGFSDRPASYFLGADRLDPSARRESATLAASRELEQAFSAYEWVTLALPIREGQLDVGVSGPRTTDFDRFIDATGGVQLLPKASDKSFDLGLEALEVSAMPHLQPLRKAAQSSLGGVVRVVSQMEAALQRLDELWRVSYLTNRPLDGALTEVRARHQSSGNLFPTPAWVRSSTPEVIANLRLRELLDGGESGGQLELTAALRRGQGDSSRLRVSADWAEAGELVKDRAVRISMGYLDASGEPWLAHSVIKVAKQSQTKEWSHELSLRLPSDVHGLAVAVEGLVARLWGSTMVAR
ncbi:MAG: hypothetical protein VYE73_08330 [Acidobacteriota bacterium]|nr:hypothetical protein [Acidobacteriota bacterium]